ncbi:hypothetical protein P153DRAFT_313377 [Dothidotthia symphoricarpi CBS 119687]|uniref:HMG box domain-containing protein n=1 Tax=Dothidotthia symphoricarpi CBS 119687 TaxID=1392245 RepID=A0A6A6AJ00_9PLEO|nr:uncharacterized protein P153DRAFT_313377 [Dothidotthia symphoricarpi CBS 119687]KAF2131075.1 hypothetical protein P153DRAFT_313377 [Dothidotthia symphoricarpi CBS 119687]
MRFLPRLVHVCAGAMIMIVLYFAWLQRPARLEETIQQAWHNTNHRIVVFGDDWSDTGNYRVSPPPEQMVAIRDPDRGEMWTETLCTELKCDFVDNFARSIPLNADTEDVVGSLADSDIYAQLVNGSNIGHTLTLLDDFQTQVQSFIAFDKEKQHIPERLRKIDEWTVFTVFFGLWDLLEYSMLDKESAMRAIDISIAEIFNNLDRLAKHVGSPTKIIIPKMVDITLLPYFQSEKDTDKEHFAENQHQSVFLWSYWNTVLSRTAAQWQHGPIFMPDPNAMVSQQVRDQQLYIRQISDAKGTGRQAPLFEEVERPCLSLKPENNATDLQAAAVEKCADPHRHLFWNDIHLSGPAHQLIGKQAAKLLRNNQTINDAKQQGAQSFRLKYVKSNMQIDDSISQSPMDDTKSARNLRKGSGVQVPWSAGKEEEPASPPAVSSPRATRKRLVPLEEVKAEDFVDNGSMEDRCPPSATSTGSGELCGSVCLCQPEPKIPRPRNAFILYRQHEQQHIIASNPGLNNPDISKIIGEKWNRESDETKKMWQDLAQEEKVRHQELYPDYRYQPRRAGKPGSSPLNPSGQHTTADKYRCHRCGGRSIKTPTSPFFDPARTPMLPPPTCYESITSTTRYLPVISNLSLQSPRGRGPGPSGLSNIQVSSAIRDDGAMYSPLTPGLKRRRFERGPPSSGQRFDYPQSSPRRESLPPIHVRRSPGSTIMPPPGTPRDVRRPSVMDLNLDQHGQPRSVEETVLSISHQSMIKLLGRITPPYKDTTPAPPVRGAIIAIEGDDLPAVKELTSWLASFLAQHEEYHAKVAEPPASPTAENVAFEDYLDLIRTWHGKSREMIRYITTPVPVLSAAEESRTASASPPTTRKDSATPSNALKPILLLPTFQLHASVAYASRIPVQDAYSSTDHWQWMATLWRGTVGPDLTIFVRTGDAREALAGSKAVELDEGVRCLTVVREREGGFGESALRRVGFEVGEFVRVVCG